MNMEHNQSLSLKPGGICLDYIPIEWSLTPLGGNKDPYIAGWQNNPFTIKGIEEEIVTGKCKAIGLLSGPVCNYPYGLVWVDVDGPTVYKEVEKLSGKSFSDALPNTLTILSGKEGRERKLYRIDREKHKHFARNKYVFYTEKQKEKLEILWCKHQGVLMGLHPETEGYYTAPGQGFEWVTKLPELPDWLLNEIINKNVKQGIPAKETTRVVGNGFAVVARVELERDIQVATEAMWKMPAEAVDDYEIWIAVGQSLHSLDESLLDVWDDWSKQSSKYKEGECHRRWLSFSKGGGRGIGTLIHLAQQQGVRLSDNQRVFGVDDAMLNHQAELVAQYESGAMSVNDLLVELHPQMAAPKENVRSSKIRRQGTSTEGKEKTPRNSSSDVIAETVVHKFSGNVIYSQARDSFFYYGRKSPGVWSQLSETEMKGVIKEEFDHIKRELMPNGYGIKLINDVLDILKIVLCNDDWYEGNEYLLFTNGILIVETRELIPFDRELHMTQQLPYDYDPEANCLPIIQWLKDAQENNWGRVQVLRAWLRAVLLSHSEVQKFVEIVGPGKSGKSTYSNLAHALVGDDNAMISSLEHLEKNRFETANLYKKKLLLFNDVERYGGSVSVLKAITGRDLIRNERKYQTGSQKPFKFNGLVMITANEPIQTTDPTSGLARRRLTIPFDKPFTGSSAEQRTLIDMDDNGRPFGEFAPLIPGLVNWVLAMSETEMREYLMETNNKVDFFAKHHRDQILKSNQIMDWMEHCVVFDPGVSTAVGLAKRSAGGSSNVYVSWDTWLYASYCEFACASNSNILGRTRFETLLMDVCVHQLGLNVYKFKDRRGMRVVNIACRASDQKYNSFPSIVEVGLNKEEWRIHYGNVLDRKNNETIEVAEESQ
jgi:phage/plasmid-associated DNA primase/DNA-binding MarR family transcriptional regulator